MKEDKVLKEFIVGIDWSKSPTPPKELYVMVGVKKGLIHKLIWFLVKVIRIKHWKKLSGLEERAYLDRFLKNWKEIEKYLSKVKINQNLEDLIYNNYDFLKNSDIVVDDHIYFKLPEELRESAKKEKDVKSKKSSYFVMLLADNIANIFRRLVSNGYKIDSKKYLEYLGKFEK